MPAPSGEAADNPKSLGHALQQLARDPRQRARKSVPLSIVGSPAVPTKIRSSASGEPAVLEILDSDEEIRDPRARRKGKTTTPAVGIQVGSPPERRHQREKVLLVPNKANQKELDGVSDDATPGKRRKRKRREKLLEAPAPAAAPLSPVSVDGPPCSPKSVSGSPPPVISPPSPPSDISPPRQTQPVMQNEEVTLGAVKVGKDLMAKPRRPRNAFAVLEHEQATNGALPKDSIKSSVAPKIDELAAISELAESRQRRKSAGEVAAMGAARLLQNAQAPLMKEKHKRRRKRRGDEAVTVDPREAHDIDVPKVLQKDEIAMGKEKRRKNKNDVIADIAEDSKDRAGTALAEDGRGEKKMKKRTKKDHPDVIEKRNSIVQEDLSAPEKIIRKARRKITLKRDADLAVLDDSVGNDGGELPQQQAEEHFGKAMSWWPDDNGSGAPSAMAASEQEVQEKKKKKKKRKHRSKVGDSGVVENAALQSLDSTQAEPDMDPGLHALLASEAEVPFAQPKVPVAPAASVAMDASAFISPFDVPAAAAPGENKRHKERRRRKHGRSPGSSGSSRGRHGKRRHRRKGEERPRSRSRRRRRSSPKVPPQPWAAAPNFAVNPWGQGYTGWPGASSVSAAPSPAPNVPVGVPPSVSPTAISPFDTVAGSERLLDASEVLSRAPAGSSAAPARSSAVDPGMEIPAGPTAALAPLAVPSAPDQHRSPGKDGAEDESSSDSDSSSSSSVPVDGAPALDLASNIFKAAPLQTSFPAVAVDSALDAGANIFKAAPVVVSFPTVSVDSSEPAAEEMQAPVIEPTAPSKPFMPEAHFQMGLAPLGEKAAEAEKASAEATKAQKKPEDAETVSDPLGAIPASVSEADGAIAATQNKAAPVIENNAAAKAATAVAAAVATNDTKTATPPVSLRPPPLAVKAELSDGTDDEAEQAPCLPAQPLDPLVEAWAGTSNRCAWRQPPKLDLDPALVRREVPMAIHEARTKTTSGVTVAKVDPAEFADSDVARLGYAEAAHIALSAAIKAPIWNKTSDWVKVPQKLEDLPSKAAWNPAKLSQEAIMRAAEHAKRRALRKPVGVSSEPAASPAEPPSLAQQSNETPVVLSLDENGDILGVVSSEEEEEDGEAADDDKQVVVPKTAAQAAAGENDAVHEPIKSIFGENLNIYDDLEGKAETEKPEVTGSVTQAVTPQATTPPAATSPAAVPPTAQPEEDEYEYVYEEEESESEEEEESEEEGAADEMAKDDPYEAAVDDPYGASGNVEVLSDEDDKLRTLKAPLVAVPWHVPPVLEGLPETSQFDVTQPKSKLNLALKQRRGSAGFLQRVYARPRDIPESPEEPRVGEFAQLLESFDASGGTPSSAASVEANMPSSSGVGYEAKLAALMHRLETDTTVEPAMAVRALWTELTPQERIEFSTGFPQFMHYVADLQVAQQPMQQLQHSLQQSNLLPGQQSVGPFGMQCIRPSMMAAPGGLELPVGALNASEVNQIFALSGKSKPQTPPSGLVEAHVDRTSEINVGPKVLCVRGLRVGTTAEQVGTTFQRYGELQSVQIKKPRQGASSATVSYVAYVTYVRSDDADRASQALHGSIMNGQPISVMENSLDGSADTISSSPHSVSANLGAASAKSVASVGPNALVGATAKGSMPIRPTAPPLKWSMGAVKSTDVPKEWNSCISFHGGVLRVNMDRKNLDNSLMHTWCRWFPSLLEPLIQADGGVLMNADLSFNNNQIGDDGVTILCNLLRHYNLHCHRISFDSNCLTQRSLGTITEIACHFSSPLLEWRMENNQLKDASLLVPMAQQLCGNRAYPPYISENSTYTPLRLCVASNFVDQPDLVVQSLVEALGMIPILGEEQRFFHSRSECPLLQLPNFRHQRRLGASSAPLSPQASMWGKQRW